ncbi:NADH-ubiquinone oxidoreductase B18 subunit-domain-containing protein [Polychytrium aggregatum]|uniref:NADH-ubiquinone oxidoreductase B18 subunit-domain-containing protein n=1 Tax=Polychytrium aggregatum TaxID=110093 RepID=UPI0022FE79CD|nr:NADH-ubiquinone oxidoreductase B18 subunit-domain-containing protein [Polychytrium aggregatum]KAI9203255.1 NADH-ubiquinone oxidoreductase B18 subunit-domain-containing protein [Polychytrium aggregatum]
MRISQAELDKTQIPHAWRDYCAHLLPDLNRCRIDSYYLPWHCENERMAWQKCQYDDYQRRMRVLAKERKDAANASVAAELN